jgi:hypothetical protein
MKSVALVVVALGVLLATAAPSLAHDSWARHGGYYAPVHHPYHPGYSASYYGGYRPVVVAPTQFYGDPTVLADATSSGHATRGCSRRTAPTTCITTPRDP